MKDPRFNTGDPIMDAALAADDAKLEAIGAYDDDGDDTNAGQCSHGVGFDERCEQCEGDDRNDFTTGDF